MDKDYEIIQNVSLAEVKEEEPQQVESTDAVVAEDVQTVEPEVVSEPVAIENPEVTVESSIDIPNIEIPNIVLPPEIEQVESTGITYETDSVQPVEEYTEPSYTDENSSLGSDDYSSMFVNNSSASTYENDYTTDNTYSSEMSFNNTSYVSEGTEEIEIDYKDEDSINRYYDAKIQKFSYETEKERAAALDQSRRYKEMAEWVNEVGKSFDFFKGRPGY